jgi:hypothetical protein
MEMTRKITFCLSEEYGARVYFPAAKRQVFTFKKKTSDVSIEVKTSYVPILLDSKHKGISNTFLLLKYINFDIKRAGFVQ